MFRYEVRESEARENHLSVFLRLYHQVLRSKTCSSACNVRSVTSPLCRPHFCPSIRRRSANEKKAQKRNVDPLGALPKLLPIIAATDVPAEHRRPDVGYRRLCARRRVEDGYVVREFLDRHGPGLIGAKVRCCGPCESAWWWVGEEIFGWDGRMIGRTRGRDQ